MDNTKDALHMALEALVLLRAHMPDEPGCAIWRHVYAVRDEAITALSAQSPVVVDDEREEDARLMDRMRTILTGVAIALKGPEQPLQRHSKHDLAEKAQSMVLERDLLKVQVEELKKSKKEVRREVLEEVEQKIESLRETISDPLIIGEDRAEAGHNTLNAAIAAIRSLSQTKEQGS